MKSNTSKTYRLSGLSCFLGAAVCLSTASIAQADIVHLDDVIIDGSLCTGFDCVNGEAFGFDTLRLKENNLRIHFDDTSASASFPANDWRIIINDSSNGGANYWAIEDATAGRQVFRVEAGAPANALYVEDDGDVGIGTSNPVVRAHLVKGDTPTMRLEQNGSSGFTPQSWDVAGNETNFFVRDVTNGSTLPFRLRPGAPSSSIDIAASGNVGFGTGSPSDDLHISKSGASDNVSINLENTSDGSEWQLVNRAVDGEFAINDNGTGGAEFIFTGPTDQTNGNTSIGLQNPTASANWQLVVRGVDGEFAINDNRTGGAEFIFRGPSAATPGLTISGTVTTTGPTCSAGCDEVFDADYDLPSIEEHASQMYASKHLPAIGPTVPKAPMNLTEQLGNMLNELEKAHIFIDQLNREKLAFQAEVNQLKTLEARIVELENMARQ